MKKNVESAKKYTVEAEYIEVQRTFKITSLYAACVITEAPEYRLQGNNVTFIRYIRSFP